MAGNRETWFGAEVILNSTDLSDQVTSIDWTEGFELLNSPAMGDDTNIGVQGLRQLSGTINFNQSFATSNVDATIRAAVATRGSVLLEVKKDGSTSTSATNPQRRVLVVLGNYTPFGGSAGQVKTASVTFSAAGDLAWLES